MERRGAEASLTSLFLIVIEMFVVLIFISLCLLARTEATLTGPSANCSVNIKVKPAIPAKLTSKGDVKVPAVPAGYQSFIACFSADIIAPIVMTPLASEIYHSSSYTFNGMDHVSHQS